MAGVRSDADRSDRAGVAAESGRERTRAGGVALVVAALALVAAGGLSGVAAAAVLGIAWLLLASTEAFALGQVGVAAFALDGGPFGLGIGLPGGASAVTVGAVALAEVGLFGLLFAPAVGRPNAAGTVAFALGWTLASGALAWAGSSMFAPWLGALVLLGATGLAAAVLHRYQTVSLGLAEEAPETGGGGDEP